MDDVLRWHGPFTFCGPEDSNIFHHELGKQNGIYLWGVPHDGGFLVNHVGEAGRSFQLRSIDHLRYWLSGFYPIYDAVSFGRGERKAVGGSDKARGMIERIADHSSLAVQTTKFLAVLRVLVAPLEADARWRRYIEGAISRELSNSGKKDIEEFFERGSRHWKRPTSEPKRVFRIESDLKIHGLTEKISV